MSVLDTERASTRSALRYRPIHTGQTAPGPAISRARRSRPDAFATAVKVAPDDLEAEEERLPRRRIAPPDPHRGAAPPVRTSRRFRPLLWLSAGVLMLLLLWVGISQLVTWGSNKLNDFRYGYPRTFQIDAVVGQGDSVQHPSHFLALNLHGNIVILEFTAGDPSKAHEFGVASEMGANADLEVVTLRFVDVNRNGRPDMLVDVGGVQSVLVNDGTTFRPPTPAEQQQILNALQQNNT